MNTQKKAVVLVSGGLDSATVLAIALDQGYECYALSMDYGQRHRVELERARLVAKSQGAVEHKVVRIDIGDFGGSALTDDAIDVPTDGSKSGRDNQSSGENKSERSSDIPVTYVPARNTVFLSVALGWAEVLEAKAIFIGANAVDYSGYPDCRPEYIDAFQTMANLATKTGVEDKPIQVLAPIIELTKAEIIQKGIALGVDYSITLSCYNPSQEGDVCGECDSCKIRLAGFEQAGFNDPANDQNQS